MSSEASRRPLPGDFRIIAAREGEVGIVLSLIKELATYERAAEQVKATEQSLKQSLFGPSPQAEVVIAWENTEPVGFALFFHNYSTWLARRGIYLEDLFVRPTHRGKGYGRALLAHLARIALERGCGRFEWSVLDWNEPAIGFYKALGAKPMDEWTVYRITGDALSQLAGEAP